ncbi:hypothetical protein [Nocardiopsis metallicus]|uniref:Uncharacterized protein n=1 Tax=Nocardiopsis metallicus TaxID=179819 RepID=A0A840W8E8_9ACTN|nr:hypothetical protein [Nocardiopsis metallicus]MBB5492344.1 hypothetical protein [Nocardiopsis metallicus]
MSTRHTSGRRRLADCWSAALLDPLDEAGERFGAGGGGGLPVGVAQRADGAAHRGQGFGALGLHGREGVVYAAVAAATTRPRRRNPAPG